ncbi:MAG TPA: UDP-N-acetylmuramate dehydrogenase [Candidatus Jorgensenbacteria bacterium]|nr:UDP-N-acetylmuramate dehydrogenase [Candidatus Jorgensenbacteria bacterium]
MALRIRRNVSTAPLSTFKIGGTAEYYVTAQDSNTIVAALQWAKERSLTHHIIAGGSNVVFPDRLLRGLLIHITGGGIHRTGQHHFIVDAGTPLEKLIAVSIADGLAGLETLTDIPGTVGGAIVGNAGAYGHSISESVDHVLIWDTGQTRELTNGACNFKYRESVFKSRPYIILRTTFVLKPGNAKQLKKRSREIRAVRRKKYDQTRNCPGSFFKNILIKNVSKRALAQIDSARIINGKIPTGYLLDSVGARNLRRGGIRVTDFHANIIENTGTGTAHDVRKLTGELKRRVKDKFGIVLEEEVRFL